MLLVTCLSRKHIYTTLFLRGTDEIWCRMMLEAFEVLLSAPDSFLRAHDHIFSLQFIRFHLVFSCLPALPRHRPSDPQTECMRSRPSPRRMSAWMSASNKIATWWLPYYHTISLLLKATNNPRKERIFISLKCEVSVIKRFIFKLNVLIIIKSSKKAQRLLSKGDSIPLPSPAPPPVSAHFTPTSEASDTGERELCRADTEEIPAFGRRASHSEGSAAFSDTQVNGDIFLCKMCKILLIFKYGKKN